ncbi:hypothetical protein BJ546DRAFT_832512, partial [Cryomyces antarcticus]
LRNLALAAVIYATIFGVIEAMKNPAKARQDWKSLMHWGSCWQIAAGRREAHKIRKLAGAKKTTTINPNANVFNRPESAVVPRDDFLGPRPHVDTEADLHLLVEECRGTYSRTERTK